MRRPFGMGYGERGGLPKSSRDSPGPGSYDHDKSFTIKRDMPKFSIGKANVRGSFQSKSVIRNPGPGEYVVPSKFAESAKFSFGLKYSEGKVSREIKNNPGPGAYSPDKLKKNNSMYSFGLKSNKDLSLAKRNIPGPGNYETKSYISEHHGGTVFGSDNKLKDFMSKTIMTNPGPGAYNTDECITSAIRKSANFKFGSSTRNNQNKTALANPGPGNYMIQRDLGRDCPSYSLSPK